MAPTLDTPRLRLRPWCDEDREPWVALCADPRVAAFLNGPLDRDRAIADAARLAERLDRLGYGWWVLELRATGAFAGCIALQDVPFEAPFTPAFEVGWRLAHEHWGNGYATEGATVALRYAFDELRRDEVVAMTAAINLPSQRVMRRLGMTYDANDDFDNPRVAVGNALRPHVLYRLRG